MCQHINITLFHFQFIFMSFTKYQIHAFTAKHLLFPKYPNAHCDPLFSYLALCLLLCHFRSAAFQTCKSVTKNDSRWLDDKINLEHAL